MAARAPIRIHPAPVDAIPRSQLESLGDGSWRSTGHDPYFEIPGPFPPGWYRASWKMGASAPLEPTLIVQFAPPQRDWIVVRCGTGRPGANLRRDHLLRFGSAVRRILLQPLAGPGRFDFRDFRIEAEAPRVGGELYPLRDLVPAGAGWESLSDDPAFECVWNKPPGLYRFRWRARMRLRASFKLYFGSDGRFSESVTASVAGARPGVAAEYSLLARVPEGTTHVQLHPCECAGSFDLEGFSADAVAEPEAGKLYPLRQIEWAGNGDSDAFTSLGVDPALEMVVPMSPGLYDLTWRASASFPLDVRFYFGRGHADYGELATAGVPAVSCADERLFRVRVRLEEAFDRLQLHPTPDRAGRFTLRDLQVRRLGHIRNWLAPHPVQAISTRPGRRWFTDYVCDAKAVAAALRSSRRWKHRPLVSIVVPIYDAHHRYLREAIESVRGQAYPNWELCIVDDASTDEGVRKLLAGYRDCDPRIRVAFRKANGHIAAAINTGLSMARGKYVGFLDQDDALHPLALHDVVQRIQAGAAPDMVYTDEDKIDELGRHIHPVFKPGWSPETLLSKMYVGHFLVIRRELLERLGGMREGCPGAQDYDLVLRAAEATGPVAHIPRVRYHWRAHAGSVAASPEAKAYAFESAQRVVQEALERRGEAGVVRALQEFPGHFEVVPAAEPRPLVSIIVPFRDQLEVTARCLGSILARSTWRPFEVLLVDNGSEPAAAARFLDEWVERGGGRVRFMSWPHPFNFSALNNAAAEEARGELLVFLNNDTEVISPDWLERMAQQAMRPSIGAVGAKLLYPDGTVQHAGVLLGVGGVAGHAHRLLEARDAGCEVTLQTVTNYAAVTAACLMCRREVFRAAGGFDTTLAVAYNDVDLCLRLLERGFRNVYVPAELYHHESLTRGEDESPQEQRRFARESEAMSRRWGELMAADPYCNPAFSRLRHDFAYDPMPVESGNSGHARLDVARRVVLHPALARTVRGWCTFRSGTAPVQGWMYVDGRELGRLEWGRRMQDRHAFEWPWPADLGEGRHELEMLALSPLGERVAARAIVEITRTCIEPAEVGRIESMRRIVPFELPIQAFVEVTTACDLACVMCRFDVKGKDVATDLFIGRDTFSRIEPLIEALQVVHLYGWGEPTLHPDYVEFIRAVRARSPACRIVFTSNFNHATKRLMSVFVEQRVDMINISIDGGTAAVYEDIRRHGSFEGMIANIQALRQMKERYRSAFPYLQYECVVQRGNVDGLSEVVALVSSLGGEVLTLEHVSDMPHLEIDYRSALPSFERARKEAAARGMRLVGTAVARFEQAARRTTEATAPASGAIPCFEPFQTLYINPGGTVSPCCMNPVVLGDLASQTIEEIWFGSRYGDFREGIMAGNLDARCRTCVSEGKNQRSIRAAAS